MPASVIRRWTYDVEAQQLLLTFTSGRRYCCLEVPEEVVGGFAAAGSKGSYFNRHIRDCFAFEPADERWLAGVDEDANYLFQIPAATPKNPPQQRKRDRDRAERMRLAGGPMPSLREKAYAFARQRTIVRTSDFTAIGIPRHYLAWMCEEGWLVREGYGLYRAAEREAA